MSSMQQQDGTKTKVAKDDASKADVQANGQDQENPDATEEIWDEERLERSLKVLKDMHIQLRNLRSTIPRMITPLTTKQPSPEALFQAFLTSTGTATREVKDFRHLMNSQERTKVLDHAKKRRAENPHGIKPWRVTDHPDWLDIES